MNKIAKRVKKKGLALGMAGVMAFACFTPVWAHGHHHHQRVQQTQAVSPSDVQCPVCTIDGCEETGRHYHDGTVYCGYGHTGGYCDGSCYSAGSCYGCHR